MFHKVIVFVCVYFMCVYFVLFECVSVFIFVAYLNVRVTVFVC